MLYGFGSNGSGQLGISGKGDVNYPKRCHFDDTPEGKNEPHMHIAAGGNHTLALFGSGFLYSVGSNVNGRAGHFSAQESIKKFTRIDLGPSIPSVKFCSATWEASVVVTTDDHIYTFGSGPRGELGTGCAVSPKPQKLAKFFPAETNVVDVASCLSHTVVVLSTGEVYGWGNGRKGQLGEPREIIWTPRKIECLTFKVVRAVCGKDFTYLVGDPQKGHHAVLGADKWSVRSSAPLNLCDWRDIGASWGSIFVLKATSQIISWGRNDRGQLGPENLPEINKMAVGSEHVLALTESRQIISWGWGEHGNCGADTDPDGDVKNRWSEIPIPSIDENAVPQKIAAGCATSFLWT